MADTNERIANALETIAVEMVLLRKMWGDAATRTSKGLSPPTKSQSRRPQYSEEVRVATKQAIDCLNDHIALKLGAHGGYDEKAHSNQKMVSALLSRGYTVRDMAMVMHYLMHPKFSPWQSWDIENRRKYFRPKTVLGPDNFEQYLQGARSVFKAE